MPTNQFLPFATGSGANVLSPTDYASLPAQSVGFQPGLLLSVDLNTPIRQAAFVASMIGQFIADKASTDANDDGNLDELKGNFVTAINNLISVEAARAEAAEVGLNTAINNEIARAEGAEALLAPIASPGFTGTPTAPTPASADNSTKLATTAFVQELIISSSPTAPIVATLPPYGSTAAGNDPSGRSPPGDSTTYLNALEDICIKYADGTMEIFGYNYLVGNIGWETVNFRWAFTKIYFVSCQDYGEGFMSTAVNGYPPPTTTTFQAIGGVPSNASGSINIRYHAKGTWK